MTMHIGPKVDPSYRVACSTFLQRNLLRFADTAKQVDRPVQNEIEWSRDARAKIPLPPVLEVVAPEGPKLGSPRGNLEPVMRNEEEIVRVFRHIIKGFFDRGVPTENVAEYFWWERRYVQKRVASAFEFDYRVFVLFDLFLQGSDGTNVGLTVHSVSNRVRSGESIGYVSLTLSTVATCGLRNPTRRRKGLVEESRLDDGGTRQSQALRANRVVSGMHDLVPSSALHPSKFLYSRDMMSPYYHLRVRSPRPEPCPG